MRYIDLSRRTLFLSFLTILTFFAASGATSAQVVGGTIAGM